MNNQTPNNFLDRRTLMAIAIVFLFWVGWSYYLKTNYPEPTPTAVPEVASTQATSGPGEPAQLAKSDTTAGSAKASEPASQEFSFDSENWKLSISSHGMAVKQILLKKYTNRDRTNVILANGENGEAFASYVGNQILDFVVVQKDANTFVGKAVHGENQIVKTLRLFPEQYKVDVDIVVSGPMATFPGLSETLREPVSKTESSSFLASSYDHSSFYVRTDVGDQKHVLVNSSSSVVEERKNSRILGLGSLYFSLAMLDVPTMYMPRAEMQFVEGGVSARAAAIYPAPSKDQDLNIRYVAFAGPKSIDILTKIDPEMHHLVDFGMFSVIGHPLLKLLKFLHDLVGNWGVAIILLTIIVRILVLPFNIYSAKSMKALQKIQPQMTALRERHKSDPQKLNTEMMQLMREHKANPLGGCLPMLLQLPVFFALFQVLGQSIELYQAPFMLWIQDLSAKDPLYVLPVLMGVAFYINQKITPTTMDPAQAKIMQWVPVLFSLMMIMLPSGLTLYTLVSTVFGIVQQHMLMRNSDNVPASAKAVKA